MKFDMTLYKPTDLEVWISRHYQENGIFTPSDLTIESVAKPFNITVTYYDGPSFAEWEEGSFSFIFLHNKQSLDELRFDFFHELCHPVRHSGIQDDMPIAWQELQEEQASQFQLYAALPYYLLKEIEPCQYFEHYVAAVSEAFCLPSRLVERRLAQIERRIYRARQEMELRARLAPPTAVYNYTETTKSLLNQLHRQVAEKQANYSVGD